MQNSIRHNIQLYSCAGEAETEHDPFVYEHSLSFITSGSAEIFTSEGAISYPAGTLSLIRRNQLLKVTKKPDGEKPFASVSVFLDQETLKKYSLEYDVKANGIYTGSPNVVLEVDPFLRGFFDSLMPYFAQPEKLTPVLEQLKTTEAIELLLRNPELKNFLFDFSEPHKLDLEAYMNRHFSYNVPIAQFAKLTGRSLSTFKRDFVKTFSATPQKWLQQQRLEKAFFLLSEKHQRPSDVYLEAGFENLSHFSYAFKNYFGQTPTQLKEQTDNIRH